MKENEGGKIEKLQNFYHILKQHSTLKKSVLHLVMNYLFLFMLYNVHQVEFKVFISVFLDSVSQVDKILDKSFGQSCSCQTLLFATSCYWSLPRYNVVVDFTNKNNEDIIADIKPIHFPKSWLEVDTFFRLQMM